MVGGEEGGFGSCGCVHNKVYLEPEPQPVLMCTIA